jgi:hypothetical protein
MTAQEAKLIAKLKKAPREVQESCLRVALQLLAQALAATLQDDEFDSLEEEAHADQDAIDATFRDLMDGVL